MHQSIRTTLLLSTTALFAAACTNMPMESQSASYNPGYTAAAPSNPVPEAGPLSEPAPAAHAPVATYTPPAANNVPVAAAPQNVPVATVPQVPAATYTQPVATNTNSGGGAYDVYAAANNTAAPVDYSQPQPNANTSYDSYGTGNTTTAATNPATNTYYPNNSNTSYDTYANNGSSYDYAANTGNTGNTGNAGYSNAVATGSSAVQVFASGSQVKAERISQDMRSQGLPAVVDMVGGLYKVRIPYPDAGAARANLMRVRQASGEAGAFVTTR